MLKKNGVGKRGSREAAKNNTYKPNEMQNTVYTAKKAAEVKKFSDLKPGMNNLFKISKQLRSGNQEVVSDKYVKNDSGNLSIDNTISIF